MGENGRGIGPQIKEGLFTFTVENFPTQGGEVFKREVSKKVLEFGKGATRGRILGV